jgi:hypothetical protein
MDTVSVIYNRRQGGGYEVSVIKDGKEVQHRDLSTRDAGQAAAYAITYKSRFSCKRIVAPEKVMKIIRGK